MLSKLAIPAYLLALLIASCSVERSENGGGGRSNADTDAGGAGEPSIPGEDERARLSVRGEPIVRLGFRQIVELEVLLESPDGDPERGQAIAFDLVGRPEDSSLSTLVARTNSEGLARVTLHAATRPVTFEVRASNGRARAVSFSITVSGNGFGSLIVHAPYSGARAVETRFVFAVPALDCDEAEYATGDRKTVFAPGDESASLIALPAGSSYAVVVVGESASGKMLTRGCASVLVADQSEDALTVAFVDRPLTPEPRFGLEMTLEAGSAAAALGAAIRASVNALVRASASGLSSPRDAEGHFWLDSLDVALRQDGGEDALSLADAIAAARASTEGDRPERELTSLLGLNEEGAGTAASAIAAHVRDALDTIVLTAGVEFESGRAPLLAIESLHIAALPVLEGGSVPSITLSYEGAAVAAGVATDEDGLQINELEFSPELGALATEALERVLDAEAAELGEDLITIAGCASLREWLEEPSRLDTSTCHDACIERAIERACEHSRRRIADAARDALIAVDTNRPVATLMGSLLLTDDDGDLRAERMEAERVDGLWEPAPGASLGDTLRGTAISSPVVAP